MGLMSKGASCWKPNESISEVFELTGLQDTKVAHGRCLRGLCEVHVLDWELGSGRFTIYDARVISVKEVRVIRIVAETVIIERPPPGDSPLSNFIELFAGFGGLGIAARFLGGKTTIAVDWNDAAVEQLRLHDIDHVLQLDLADTKNVKGIHDYTRGTRPTALMGFPCQPHSTQGWQQGFADPRAGSLGDGLWCIYMLQCEAAVLECVCPAGMNHMVQQEVTKLCELMDWTFQQVNLDLTMQWPSHRKRWWALLFPKAWEKCDLVNWMRSAEHCCVGDILADWKELSAEEESCLRLSEQELQDYGNQAYGKDVRQLTFDQKAQTILHSYGNATGPCPCGCRPRSFSINSLLKKGLRGYYVVPEGQQPRFLHPSEAAIILGVHPCTRMAENPRRNLCMLGLIASPLQGVWIIAHLLKNYDIAHEQKISFTPELALHAYKKALLNSTANAQSYVIIERPCEKGNQNVISIEHLKVMTQDVHQELLEAESKYKDWGHKVEICAEEGLLGSAPDAWMIRHVQKKQRTQQPTESVYIHIFGGRKNIVTAVPRGMFFFEVLVQLGINPSAVVQLNDGRQIRTDFRIWHAGQYRVFAPGDFPSLGSASSLCGAGGEPEEIATKDAQFAAEGLTEIVMHKELIKIAEKAAWNPLQVWSPRFVERVTETWPRLSHALIREARGSFDFVVGTMCDAGHWVSFVFIWETDGLSCVFFDGLREMVSPDAAYFAQKVAIATSTELKEVKLCKIISQTRGNHCGTIALLHLGILAGLPGHYTEEYAETWFEEIVDDLSFLIQRARKTQNELTASPTLEWLITGTGPTQEQALANLLCEKGVPHEQSEQRAKAVIAKIGHAMIAHALRSSTPWQILKTAANSPNTRIRLVHPDEQKQFIEKKAADKTGAKIQKKQKHFRTREQHEGHLTLDPSLLTISEDHLQDENGNPVPVVSFHELVVGGRGIALSDCRTAKPFIDNPKKITEDAMAVILVDLPPTEIAEQAGILALRYPAVYTGTKEHILVCGGILNVGDNEVSRNFGSMVPQPEVLNTAVLKITVCREHLQISWTEFAKTPIKAILAMLPTLMLCPGKNCGAECLKSHQTVGEQFDSILLEIWSRAFSLSQGGKTLPEAADTFTVFARIPSSVLDQAVTHMVPGIFVEPRQDGTSGAHPNYRVVWLPKCSFEDAMHQRKTCTFALSLVRQKDRFGLRVLKKDEGKAWSVVRPGEVFTDIPVNEVYDLGPFPHGTTRTAIIEMLQGWGWKARPLQPGRGNRSHVTWRIGASTPPPSLVLQSGDMDIIATPLKQEIKPQKTDMTFATWKTQAHIKKGKARAEANQTTDPWEAGGDPWANYKTSAASSNVQKERTYIGDMTNVLEKSIEAQVKRHYAELKEDLDQHMPQADLDHEQAALASAVQELKAKNEQYEQWFKEASHRFQQVEQHSQETQNAIQAQQQELQTLRGEMQQTAATQGAQIQQALGQVKRDIVAELQEANSKHFAQLEAMMAKKTRQE